MRYRPSHAVRLRQFNKTQRYERLLRSLGLVLVVTALVIGGGWVFIFTEESSDLFAWLFNRPLPVDQPVDKRTASFKKDEGGFRELELALSRALINLQVSSDQVKETQSRPRQSDGNRRAVQRTIRVADAYSLIQCNHEINRAVSQIGGKVIRATERRRSHELLMDITYDGYVAYHLTIIRDPSIIRKTGGLAIIINQAGKSRRDILDQFLELKRPMTFGFVPWESGAKKMAAETVRKNQEVIVNLPMEPKSYPRISPGKKAILIDQDAQTNRRIVREALSILSVAMGVSNYMGDKIRETPEIMNLVLDEVKKHNKYYIDGFDGSQRPGDRAVHLQGLQSAVSWGALDDHQNQERIAMRLDQASFAALEQSAVIVTANAHANLLAVLSHKMKQLELRGIEFVHVSDIVINKE